MYELESGVVGMLEMGECCTCETRISPRITRSSWIGAKIGGGEVYLGRLCCGIMEWP